MGIARPDQTKENSIMQPQAGKQKPKHPVLASDSTRVPVTAIGQRYEAPAGRHSQQSHRLAQLRASDAGHASEKEQHDHDRKTKSEKIAKTAADLKRNKEQSAQK